MEKIYSQAELRELENKHLIHNYAPFEPIFTCADGCIVQDMDGKRYLDMLSCYSALNVGHGHPRILKALFEDRKSVV